MGNTTKPIVCRLALRVICPKPGVYTTFAAPSIFPILRSCLQRLSVIVAGLQTPPDKNMINGNNGYGSVGSLSRPADDHAYCDRTVTADTQVEALTYSRLVRY
jgi:hypothetical protein